jgi:lipoprotein-anchoring transpeptidase ErfK/SrfK
MNGAEGSPDFYSLDLVPYAQYFDGLISMHGTYWHNSCGYPHSHGGVNLTVSDAMWLFNYLGEGSVVHVYLGGA